MQKNKGFFITYVSPTLAMMSNYTKNLDENDKNLAIFIPNDLDINESVNQFVHLYSKRTKADKEYWLVDISACLDINKMMDDLKDIPLDLDDDLFLYAENLTDKKPWYRLYEFYEIHKSKPRKILSYGNWSQEKGLIFPNEDKWVRRQNLEVCIYFTKMSFM